MNTHTTTPSNPPQPPKQSAYTQSSNPVSHNPLESHQTEQRTPAYGTAPSSITRGASSHPSQSQSNTQPQSSPLKPNPDYTTEQDPQYGVEQQSTEGSIAHAVESQSRHRIQAGAHAGPIGAAQGPGAPAYGEGPDNLADLDRKTDEHFRVLGERAGRTPPIGEQGEEERNEGVRERKLERDEELRAGRVVGEVSGGGVAGR
ncbi:hypothetical protein BJY04DRAFT_214563 [Aspergillus karnatakaensis]|uniref:uncharacterized protein n=1 Tax=Aspergillus karnatakaensis TaxID=1810916 RepID=UPI003CCE23F8